MEIIRLAFGERAPLDSDCVSIEHLPDGRFRVSGSLLTDGESTALVGITCDTMAEAEDQGLAWANGCSPPQVYLANIPAIEPL